MRVSGVPGVFAEGSRTHAAIWLPPGASAGASATCGFASRAWQAAHFANQMAIGTFYNDKMCLNDDTKYLALTFTNQVCNAT